MQLFSAMGMGALIQLLANAGVFRASNDFQLAVGRIKDSFVRFGLTKESVTVPAGGATTFQAPAVSPAYLGVGFIIGPELGALNFAGGLLAWGLFVPLLIFFIGPELAPAYTAADGRHGLGRPGRPRLAFHRAADRGRRHAGRCELHARQDAEEPDRRPEARDRRREEVGDGAGHDAAHRT